MHDELIARLEQATGPDRELEAERGLIASEPVDSLLVEAIKIAEAHNYCRGDLAQDVALAALKRGMELQREKMTALRVVLL